jgi:hypothetical protein
MLQGSANIEVVMFAREMSGVVKISSTPTPTNQPDCRDGKKA